MRNQKEIDPITGKIVETSFLLRSRCSFSDPNIRSNLEAETSSPTQSEQNSDHDIEMQLFPGEQTPPDTFQTNPPQQPFSANCAEALDDTTPPENDVFLNIQQPENDIIQENDIEIEEMDPENLSNENSNAEFRRRIHIRS